MSQPHPTTEDWMNFLYDEVSADRKQEFARHLDECRSCSDRIKHWQLTMSHLDCWSPDNQSSSGTTSVSTPIPNAHRGFPVWMQWTVTLACLATAFFLGRLTAIDHQQQSAVATPDITAIEERLRSTVERTLTDQVAQQLSDQQQQMYESQKQTSEQTTEAMLAVYAQQDFQDRRQTRDMLNDLIQNQIALRQDLETLAVEAEAQILKTQREIRLLNSNRRLTENHIPTGLTRASLNP